MTAHIAAKLVPGHTETKPYTFDAGNITAFAAAAGDMNHLHHDPATAATTRFGGLIASGAHMSAVLMGFGASMVTRDHASLGLNFCFRFERAIPAGTDTVLSWTIVTAAPHPKLGGTLLDIEGAILGLDGKRYVSSTGQAVIWDKQP